jgi:TetR/AcrR family transcriptional repressor of nem operon
MYDDNHTMRYSEAHKATVRQKIIQATSRALRKSGLEGMSIPALMKKVGLTHGGFYSHFADRDELVAAAVTAASLETGAAVFTDSPNVDATLQAYLSEQHVNHPEAGCVIAALGPEASHQSAPIRKAFAAAAEGMLALVAKKLEPAACGQVSDEALRLASRMVGAVVLARLVEEPALRRRLLAAARVQ